MRVDVHSSIPAQLAETAWQLYVEAFDELRSAAVQRHVMLREEFEDLMRDRRVAKCLGYSGERLCALSTVTNQLDAVSLVSPDYFQRHWPAQFSAGRIYYIVFLGIHPDCRSTGLFERMCEEMYRVAGAAPGLVVFDVCRRNQEYRFPQAIRAALEQVHGEVRPHRLDEQTYWLYELPTAA
jgi:ribosomal protein S18 acetylase RimI-like enzyme